MHRCFQVPELVRCIVAEISTDSSPLDTYDQVAPCKRPLEERVTYAALSRVSKVFYEPAMDALWFEVHSLKAILEPILPSGEAVSHPNYPRNHTLSS